MGQSKTSKYYAANPKAAEKRREYQRDLNATPERKRYRAEHNAARRSTKSGKFVKENPSKNRARNGANGKSVKK